MPSIGGIKPSEADDAAVHEKERAENVETKDEPMKLDAKLMIILTAIIAVATAINVWVFWYESEDSSKKLQTLSDKAGGIVDSMNTALSNNHDAIKKAFDANKEAPKLSATE